jgi:hypothetical protein
MSAAGPAKAIIAQRLHQAVERLHADIAHVEFWTDALGGFAEPIPDYDPGNIRLNEFILPQQKADRAGD